MFKYSLIWLFSYTGCLLQAGELEHRETLENDISVSSEEQPQNEWDEGHSVQKKPTLVVSQLSNWRARADAAITKLDKQIRD